MKLTPRPGVPEHSRFALTSPPKRHFPQLHQLTREASKVLMDLEGGRHLTFDHQGKRFTVLTHDDFQRAVEQAITAKKVQEQLPLLRSALELLKENPT